jgi:diaminopimelate decarboxylase
MKYFQVTVSITDINEKGKQTRVTEQYLVDSDSVTEAEAKVVKMYEDEGAKVDYAVKSVKETKILVVIE